MIQFIKTEFYTTFQEHIIKNYSIFVHLILLFKKFLNPWEHFVYTKIYHLKENQPHGCY